MPDFPAPRVIARYGWRRDSPDYRDHLYAAPPSVMASLPASVDLRPQCPPVYDQGQLGSCTGNAIAGAVEFERMRQNLTVFTPSRLFIYYGERVIEGTVGSDSGAEIRDGIKVVATAGAPPETDWPYDVSRFAEQPSAQAYADAKDDVATQYQRVTQSLVQMKGCLASGLPFVFGFTVYESFESAEVASTGQAPMPGPIESVVGGHAVVAVGYYDSVQRFLCRNSWGLGWGMAGYFTLPYAYLASADLASDLWVIQQEGGSAPPAPPGPSPVPAPPASLWTWLANEVEHLPAEVMAWIEAAFGHLRP
jgi:C1A family cysteine protease